MENIFFPSLKSVQDSRPVKKQRITHLFTSRSIMSFHNTFHNIYRVTPKKITHRIERPKLLAIWATFTRGPWAILSSKAFLAFSVSNFFLDTLYIAMCATSRFLFVPIWTLPLGLRCHRVPYSGSALPEDPTRGTIWDWSILYPEQRSKAWVAGGIVSITSIILFTLMRNVFR